MKYFVINLERRQDRFEQFKNTFNKIEITREPAVDCNELKMTPGLKKRINEWNFKYVPHKVKNLTACCLSHLNVWRKISKLDEPAFVFEDDCTFINESVKEHFQEYFDSLILPKDFGIIWFNGNIQDKPGKHIELPFQIKENKECNTTESYLLSPSFAKELIFAIEKDLGAVDNHMGTYIGKTQNKSFKVFPPFFCQFDRKDTDIQIN